jgi:hypothetical protein
MKLNQIVAVEKSTKSDSYSALSELHKLSQKPALFNGFIKSYRKTDDQSEDFSNESQKVQHTTSEVVGKIQETLAGLFDITATKDFGNAKAKADIVFNGEVLIKDVPIPYLLFLQKQLTDLETALAKLPVLDEAETWTLDENSGKYVTDKSSTHRTKKVQKPIVLYPATPEHPAQTQLVSEDVIVGFYETVKHSGAMPSVEREKLVNRVRALTNAVREAREEANNTEVEKIKVADKIFAVLFN